VLRRFPYGESSLVVHVLTPSHGRLTLLAKGAYRPRSGYCGVLDLFDTLDLEWRRQRLSDIGLLTGGSVRIRRRGITKDLGRYRAGLSVLELAGLGGREGEADRPLYELAEETLDVLDEGRTDPELAVTAFDLRFLACMGLTPALTSCAACGRDLEERSSHGARTTGLVPFSRGAGGRLCPRCAEEARGSGRHVEKRPVGTLRIARSLMEVPAASLARIRIDPPVREEVRSFTEGFLEYHLETRPRTRRRGGARKSSRTPASSPPGPTPRGPGSPDPR